MTIVSENMERRLYANDKLAKMFGAETPENLLIDRIEDSWCDVERYQQMKAFIASGQDLENFVAKRRRADGSVFWVTMNSQMAEVEGHKARIIWMSDVTDLVGLLRDTGPATEAKSA
ncbi:MAG: PAS domain S-box protein [Rhodospirillales bacterium]|nr:PAS domain S-box protein [Rhodospirillales bacterium]